MDEQVQHCRRADWSKVGVEIVSKQIAGEAKRAADCLGEALNIGIKFPFVPQTRTHPNVITQDLIKLN